MRGTSFVGAAVVAVVLAFVLPSACAASTTVYIRPTADIASSSPWSIVGTSKAWEALDDPVTSAENPNSTDYISANVSHNEGKVTEVGGFKKLSGLAGAKSITASGWFYSPTTAAVELQVRNSSHNVASQSFTGSGWHSLAFSISQANLEEGELSLRFNTGTNSGLRQIYASFISVTYTASSPGRFLLGCMDGWGRRAHGRQIPPWGCALGL